LFLIVTLIKQKASAKIFFIFLSALIRSTISAEYQAFKKGRRQFPDDAPNAGKWLLKEANSCKYFPG
jgi:hypothetical protein